MIVGERGKYFLFVQLAFEKQFSRNQVPNIQPSLPYHLSVRRSDNLANSVES